LFGVLPVPSGERLKVPGPKTDSERQQQPLQRLFTSDSSLLPQADFAGLDHEPSVNAGAPETVGVNEDEYCCGKASAELRETTFDGVWQFQ
jgi:hypothetical protein